MIEPDWIKLHPWHLKQKLAILGIQAGRALGEKDNARYHMIRKEAEYIANVLKIRDTK